MTDTNQWRAERQAKRLLTPLNRATHRAVRACVRRGGHQGSGSYVLRDFGIQVLDLEVCARCALPIGAPSGGWSNPGSAKRGGSSSGA